MSIPPNQPPPGNLPPYDNYPPGGYRPSPPAKSGSGWKIAGFGCLGLFLLAAIGGVLLVRNVKNSISHPSKSSIFGIGILAGQASLDGQHLQQAVVAYHAKHGAYPQTLMDLYTDGSIDGKLLHNDLDDSPDPAHVSWRYQPPAEGAPGSTPILQEPYHLTIGGATTPGKITIDLDGHSQSDSSRQTNDAEPAGGTGSGGTGSGTGSGN